MSKIRLHGTSSGYTDIAPTAAAGNNTLTAPTGTGTLVAEDSSGNITISEGLVHTGDTNTKIKFPAADTITAETGGSERLRITSAGKVLIGTATPQGNANADDLVVSTAGHSGVSIRSGTSHHGNIFFADATSGGGEYSGWITYQHDNLKLTFGTDAGERLVIDSNGNTNITGIVTATTFVPTEGLYGTKNLIHNGGMMVWQRSTSVATQDGTDEGFQSVDGYYNSFVGSANGAYTISKSTEAPDGFNSSIKYDVTTANTNSSDGNRTIYIWQNIEAQNVVNSGWKPTSTSDYLTFSFYFKTNKGGTNKLAVHLTEHGNTYSYVTDITVSDTNWNRYSVTVPGHASITIPNDNTGGLKVGMAFMVSPGFQTSDTDQWLNSREYGTSNSTNWFDSTSNEWYTTGWQVEVGSHATPFEHRSYGDELSRCQRYLYVVADGASNTLGLATMYQSGHMWGTITYPVTMRATPTLTASSGTDYYEFVRNGAADWFNSLTLDNRTTNKIAEIYNNSEVSGTVGHTGFIRTDNAAVKVIFNAEL